MRCNIRCKLCNKTPEGYIGKVVNLGGQHYEWCVHRHSEPLLRGEYTRTISSEGGIAGTVCYTETIVKYAKTTTKRGKVTDNMTL
jgi:hypothetical protein